MDSLQIAALLQDSEAIREPLARELRPVSATSLRMHGLKIDYFRQSPTRVVAQYSLDLESDEGVRDSQIITVAHFTDGRMDRQWERMRADAADAEAPVGKFHLPGARYSEGLQSIVQVFPFDARLPGLRNIVAGTPEIRRLVAPQAADQIASWNVEVVRYRPDMRAMARVDYLVGNHDQGGTQRVYAKAYREVDEGQRAFDLLKALAAHADASGGFQVPRPLAYDADLRTLLIAEATGIRLLEIIRQNADKRVPDAVRRAARAVAAMHGAPITPALLPAKSPDKDAQFVEVTARLLRTFPEQSNAVQTLATQIGAAFRPASPRPTHYDLKQGHILIDSMAVTILDFDKMALGDPLIDVANVVATLSAEREGSARRAERRENLADIFVDEYFSNVPGEWAALFPAHLARAVLVEAATTGRGNRGRRGISQPEERLVSALRRAEEILRM
jgi:aminoglycoside phosphotransferase (APT) family kinase protein